MFGGIIRGLGKAAMPKINMAGNAMGFQNMNIDSGWFPEGDDIQKSVQMRDNPEGRLIALENAIGLGNFPQATQQFLQPITKFFGILDFDSTEEYLNGLVEFSHKNTLSEAMESVNWNAQNIYLSQKDYRNPFSNLQIGD